MKKNLVACCNQFDNIDTMGLFGSSEEQNIDNKGEVNNNVIVQNPVTIQSEEMVTLLGIICILKITEFIYVCFKAYQRYVKKKYQPRQ